MFFAAISNSETLLILSSEGKSAAGKVTSEKRLRPDFTNALSAFTLKLIKFASFGKALQISSNFRAGMVISPGSSTLRSQHDD